MTSSDQDYEDLIARFLKRREEERRMLEAMTPDERAAWIAAWAKRVAAQEVEEGTRIDRCLRGEHDHA